MGLVIRFLRDHKGLWPVWLPLLAISIAAPISSVIIPLVEKRLIDTVILGHRPDLLMSTAGLYVGLWLLSTCLLVVGGLLRTYLGERLALALRYRIFTHYESLSVAFAHREHSGRTMSLFVNDVPNTTSLFSTTIVSGVGAVIALLGATVVMFRLSPQLAVVAVGGPLLAAVVAAFVTRPLRPAVRKVQEILAELNERLQENLEGIREVVAFGREEPQAQHVLSILWNLVRLRMRVTKIEMTISTGASILSLAVTVTIFIYGTYLVLETRTSLGTVIAMRSLFGLVFQPAGQLIGLFTSTQKALGAADRIYAFLDQTPRVVDKGERSLPQVAGEVLFDAVDFSYREGEPVLEGVSFVAHPGQLTALVGPSGAGKSTVAALMARFYDPDHGRILLDDVDLRDLPLDDLRAHVGFVFQDTFLFAASIRENIAFGREHASEEEVIAAAQAAQAWEFIERLPEGLATLVGERGVQLSEGQRQRLAIARAFLRDPRVLILDEPTSALDARSEQLLQAAMNNLTHGRTTFVIAHRLSTIQRADQILVFDGGRLVEHGTHVDLLDRHGLYRELCELQFGGATPAPQMLPGGSPLPAAVAD